MDTSLTRREFFRLSALGAASLPLSGALTAVSAQDIERPSSYWNASRVVEIPSFCEMCFWRCGIVGKVSKGQLVKIEGNTEHPLNEGRLCARGSAGMGQLYDPDRLKYPLQRVGARGEGRFRRISWDDAFRIIGEKLKGIKADYGPNAVAYFPHGISASYFKQAMNAFGTGLTTSASFYHCRGPRDVGYELTFGMGPGSPERLDFPKSKCIVLIGSHIGENVHTSHVQSFIEGLSNGAKLIVADPRYSVAASKSHYWLAVKPGTDTALILSWLHQIIADGLYDKEFVENHTVGFEKLTAAVREYTPEWGENQTGIAADIIRETARTIGEAHPAVVIHPGRHTTWYGNDTQRSRAMAILTAILGSWGREGGIFLPSPLKTGSCPCSATVDEEKVPFKEFYPFKHEGIPSEKIVQATISQEIPVKAWIIYGQNICQSQPLPHQTMAALKKLDFVVAVDILPTESVMWADIVLPESTYLERYDSLLKVKDAHDPFIVLRQPVVKPMYETRDAYQIAKGFAEALELKECFPCPDIEATLDFMLKPTNVPLEKLKRIGIQKFKGKPYYLEGDQISFHTPSGKVELYSSLLEQYGFSPIPAFEPPDEVPAGYVRLVNGRAPVHTFTRTLNNKMLLELMPRNPIWINEELGLKVGLKNGEKVILENQDGLQSQPVPILLTAGIRPDVVFMVHGFGSKSKGMTSAFGKGASDTCLYSRIKTDPETGAAGIRVNFVRIVKNGQLLDLPSIPLTKTYLKRADRSSVATYRQLKEKEIQEMEQHQNVAPLAPPSAGYSPAEGCAEGC